MSFEHVSKAMSKSCNDFLDWPRVFLFWGVCGFSMLQVSRQLVFVSWLVSLGHSIS
jgi:hypothetical protein